jgi:hypothetical protein
MSEPWSIRYDETPFTKFLFATGDWNKWLVMNKDDVLIPKSFSEDQGVKIVKSSA